MERAGEDKRDVALTWRILAEARTSVKVKSPVGGWPRHGAGDRETGGAGRKYRWIAPLSRLNGA